MPSTKKKLFTTENLLYCCAACLLPNIFLFFLYNSNKALNDIPFLQCLMLALGLGLLSVAGFVFFRVVAKSGEGALISLLPLWLSFWLFEQIFALIRPIVERYADTHMRMLLLLCLFCLICLTSLLLRRYAAPFSKTGASFAPWPRSFAGCSRSTSFRRCTKTFWQREAN